MSSTISVERSTVSRYISSIRIAKDCLPPPQPVCSFNPTLDIQVGTSHSSPSAIGRRSRGVKHRSVPFEDSDSSLQQSSVAYARHGTHDGNIACPGRSNRRSAPSCAAALTLTRSLMSRENRGPSATSTGVRLPRHAGPSGIGPHCRAESKRFEAPCRLLAEIDARPGTSSSRGIGRLRDFHELSRVAGRRPRAVLMTTARSASMAAQERD